MADPRLTSTLASHDAMARPYAAVLLNRYRIMNTHRTGGFGTVLTCWDTRLQRRVAIKRLPIDGASSQTLNEALAEARTASVLAHPNIVTVHDFEVDNSYAYIVMEYVDGLNLADLLARVEGGVLTHDETAAVVRSVAGALAFAHQNGVLHLDIKPTNIMVDRSGTVKLCDFGMATLTSAAGYGGARGGTVGYMPPEQIEGDVVDERTDVFSLAVVVWQALLGYNPFAAPTAAKSLALINKGPGKPSKKDSKLAGFVEDALLCALAPQPADRTSSVQLFAKQVLGALGNPIDGKQSLHSLLSQSPGDAADASKQWEGKRLPIVLRFPWLASLFVRLATAAAVTALAPPLIRSFSDQGDPITWGVAVLCGLVTAAWPPLGTLLVTVAFCASIIVHATSLLPVVLGVVLALVMIVWWLYCGARGSLTNLIVTLPMALTAPVVGTPIAGMTLTPVRAMTTSCMAWLLGNIWIVALATRFSLSGSLDTLVDTFVGLPSLISLGGCCLAALLCSVITFHNRRILFAVLGQVVCSATLIGTLFLVTSVENGGIWRDATRINAIVAVILSVIVCIACMLHGPRSTGLESED